jgi:hypothetical protein
MFASKEDAVDEAPVATVTLPYGIAIGVGSLVTLGLVQWT